MDNNIYSGATEARPHQISIDEALSLKVTNLFQDEDSQGRRLLSRADLILIFTLYDEGLVEFLKEYKKYVKDMSDDRGYKFIVKPHYYLKNILG